MSPCAPHSIRVFAAALAVVFTLAAKPAVGVHPKVEFPELAHAADVVFVGTVDSLSSRIVDGGRMVMTDVHFGDLDVIHRKDHVPSDLSQGITLTFAGGEANGMNVSVSEVPRFAVGDRVLLFARMDGTVYANPLVAGVQGLFRVKRDAATGVEYPFTNGNSAVSSTEGGRLRLLQRVDRIENGQPVLLPRTPRRMGPPQTADAKHSVTPSQLAEPIGALTLPEFITGIRAALAGPPPVQPRLTFSNAGIVSAGRQPSSIGMAANKSRNGIPTGPDGLGSLRQAKPSTPAMSPGIAQPAAAGGIVALCHCGHQNLHADMEQVPESFWSWKHNDDAMWMYNQFMDVYRYHASDGDRVPQRLQRVLRLPRR